jgi:hypothetical protein
MWPMWEAIAPTTAYHAAVMGEDASVPTARAARLAVPALVMTGGATYPFMYITATALAQAIPNAKHHTLEGQTHEVAAEALDPVLGSSCPTCIMSRANDSRGRDDSPFEQAVTALPSPNQPAAG